jgi:hypothetical protein
VSVLRPIRKTSSLIALIAACVAVIVVIPAHATPIRPDVQRLLSQPQAPAQFVPARAGWQGPETPPVPREAVALRPSTAAKAMRASLLAAAIPDPWAVLAIAAAILFLRWMRLSRGRQQFRPEVPDEALDEVRRAA